MRWSPFKTRVNNAHNKAKATSRIYLWNPDDVSQADKELYYPFYHNNAFEDVENEKILAVPGGDNFHVFFPICPVDQQGEKRWGDQGI